MNEISFTIQTEIGSYENNKYEKYECLNVGHCSHMGLHFIDIIQILQTTKKEYYDIVKIFWTHITRITY